MSQAPKLNIQFSKDSEIERITYIYNELNWYKEHGYNVRFPGGKRLSDFDTIPTLDMLLNELDIECIPDVYEDAKSDIIDSWLHLSTHWPSQKIANTTLTFEPSYTICLTRYGTGGSYDLPNKIEINIDSCDRKNFEKVLFHEMIHLCIEPLVQKYHTPHWYKERIVDLTFKKLLPDTAFEQNLPKEVLRVDTHFNQQYGDFETIISLVSQI